MNEFAWSWSDYTGSAPPKRHIIGGASRPGGKESRFVGHGKAVSSASAVSIPIEHKASRYGRTLFPRSVKAPHAVPRILVSGINNPKTGKRVLVGPWKGMPIYTLTLEERATCPRSCEHWTSCYGNAMPLARRHRHGPDLEARLKRDIPELIDKHGGIVIRLHVLGDFYSPRYVWFWSDMLRRHPALHVWGYTAWDETTATGRHIRSMNETYPGQCSIRFTVPASRPIRPMEAATVWDPKSPPVRKEGFVCPAQIGTATGCGSCGLCWLPSFATRRIVFLGHGNPMVGRQRG
jgi:hypothetical protein